MIGRVIDIPELTVRTEPHSRASAVRRLKLGQEIEIFGKETTTYGTPWYHVGDGYVPSTRIEIIEEGYNVYSWMMPSRIQYVLEQCGNITFKPGKYNIGISLVIDDDTHIVLEDGVVICQTSGAPVFTTRMHDKMKGYSGTKNVLISGGELIANTKSDGKATNYDGDVIVIFHASDIVIKNMTIINRNENAHSVLVFGSRNIEFTNCNFDENSVVMGDAIYEKYDRYRMNAPCYDKTNTKMIHFN